MENIQYRSSDGKLAVGTHGTGIYTTSIETIYDIYPIWSYNCLDGNCIDIVDGTGEFTTIEECEENCFEPLKDNKIYPNPSTNYSIVEWNSTLMFETLTLSDSEGKILQKWNIENTDNLRINTNNLSAGIYFVTLKGAENKLVEKLVIID